MALAVLELASATRVGSERRVLDAAQWRLVGDAAALRERAAAAVARAQDHARETVVEELRQRADQLERQVQKQLLLKTMNLQIEHERMLRELRSRFVETVLTSLRAMLTPLPPSFFARVHASAASMLGTDAQAVLHVSAVDEGAARLGLSAARDRVAIQVDPDLEPGQCFLSTRFGRVQAGLATQLEALGEALTAWWTTQQEAGRS